MKYSANSSGVNCKCFGYTANIMLEQYLVEIGLSDKEAKVYLALLVVDNSPISDIAKRAKINRTTVYPVLQSLEKKGLVSEVPVGKTIHYQAAPPERLQQVIGKQRLLLEERAQRLKDIVPQIKSISREGGERPIIKVFEGKDGALSAYEEFYELHDKAAAQGYFIYNRDLLEEEYSKADLEKFKKIRLRKQVEPTSVYTKKSGDHAFTTKGRRVRIDSEKYPIHVDVTVIDDRIIFSALKNSSVSIVIKCRDIAVSLASIVRYINDSANSK